jgi:hypothetical protein
MACVPFSLEDMGKLRQAVRVFMKARLREFGAGKRGGA